MAINRQEIATEFGHLSINPRRGKLRGDDGYSEVLAQLDIAMTEQLSDDEESPSPSTVDTAKELLHSIFLRNIPGLPKPRVYADGFGGIRAEWTVGSRYIALVLRRDPAGRHYIYHQEGKDFDTDYHVDSVCLANWLEWLCLCRNPLAAS